MKMAHFSVSGMQYALDQNLEYGSRYICHINKTGSLMRTALFTDKDHYDILLSRKPVPDLTSAFL